MPAVKPALYVPGKYGEMEHLVKEAVLLRMRRIYCMRSFLFNFPALVEVSFSLKLLDAVKTVVWESAWC